VQGSSDISKKRFAKKSGLKKKTKMDHQETLLGGVNSSLIAAASVECPT
jgi:hypothetical protein